MSVDYKATLIYGYDCDPEDWTCEEIEGLMELGWDIVRDCDADTFLYIGIKMSSASCYEKASVDVFKALHPAMLKFSELLYKTPEQYKIKLPLSGSVYHLCYAT